MTDSAKPSRRDLLVGSAALLGAGVLPAAADRARAAEARADDATPAVVPPARPPGGYNILFILVDQEHFFPAWPFPVPGREWIKRNGITFTNHQAASCVCSPARSTIYTGEHIQHSGIFDNLNALWQPDLAAEVKTIGHRLADLGYYAAYQGKWHLSANLDVTTKAIEAPFPKYREIIANYGFQDFFGVGDLVDRGIGGYTYDDATTAAARSWLRTRGQQLKADGTPWFLAVNLVNPHDVMYVDSDRPGETLQGRKPAMPIFRPPDDEIYGATWDQVPLPPTRGQAFDAPGRPKAHAIYQTVQDVLVGPWPDEDRRWRLLLDYYFNCMRDCDRQVVALLDALRESGQERETIIVFNADHGELAGNHQMRGKGNCTYRQQNHVPLMIVHPAYPGGLECAAVTSQIDLAPTLLELTGAPPERLGPASAGLKGRSIAPLLAAPAAAAVDTLRPAALFNYNMLTFQDALWTERMVYFMDSTRVPLPDKIEQALKIEPNFHDRCGIRSLFDGRYRFSRYFAPLDFNTPVTWEELVAHNDLELYDLEQDPEEVENLALDRKAHGDLVLALNDQLNALIQAEVGTDDGSFLPLRDGKWSFPGRSQR